MFYLKQTNIHTHIQNILFNIYLYLDYIIYFNMCTPIVLINYVLKIVSINYNKYLYGDFIWSNLKRFYLIIYYNYTLFFSIKKSVVLSSLFFAKSRLSDVIRYTIASIYTSLQCMILDRNVYWFYVQIKAQNMMNWPLLDPSLLVM